MKYYVLIESYHGRNGMFGSQSIVKIQREPFKVSDLEPEDWNYESRTILEWEGELS